MSTRPPTFRAAIPSRNKTGSRKGRIDRNDAKSALNKLAPINKHSPAFPKCSHCGLPVANCPLILAKQDLEVKKAERYNLTNHPSQGSNSIPLSAALATYRLLEGTISRNEAEKIVGNVEVEDAVAVKVMDRMVQIFPGYAAEERKLHFGIAMGALEGVAEKERDLLERPFGDGWWVG
ncbi:hypothetical protein MMC08_001661 [Hypocenomyce scalaris]|nr:hypothetical protein [Hypocenomyce scalaris]